MKPMVDHPGKAIVDAIVVIGTLKEASKYLTEIKDDAIRETDYEMAAFYRDRLHIVLKVIADIEDHLYTKSAK